MNTVSLLFAAATIVAAVQPLWAKAAPPRDASPYYCELA